jgi:methyl-accepting chemotaxis protein
MKKPLPRSRLGKIMMVLAIAGMVFSLVGIAAIWILRSGVTQKVSDTMDIFHATLITTGDAVDVLSGVVDKAEDDLSLIQSSLDSLGESIEGISTSLATSSALIGDDLSLTVTQTQIALSSAATGAEIIDDTLSFLAAIPILGADYEPDVPLHVGLTQVADGLEDIPDSLDSLEGNLNTTSEDLSGFSEDLVILSDDLGTFSEDLDETRGVLADYDTIITNAITRFETFQSRLGGYSILLSLILSGVLLWLGIAQFNVYLSGYEYVHYEEKTVSLSDLTRD